jgi:hypothetical protein
MLRERRQEHLSCRRLTNPGTVRSTQRNSSRSSPQFTLGGVS